MPGLGVIYLLATKGIKPSVMQAAGFILGLVGVAIISVGTADTFESSNVALGVLLAAVAVISFFYYGILCIFSMLDFN